MNWPAGVGGKGSDGVTGQVRQTPGAIGYTELTYAHHEQDRLRLGAERGRQVRQGVDRVGHRGGGRGRGKQMPADFRVSITNAAGRRRLSDRVVHLAAALRESDGQGAGQGDGRVHEVGARPTGRSSPPEMGYAPLPKAVVDLELKALAKIKTQ